MAGSPNFLAGLVHSVTRSLVSRIIGVIVLVVVAGLIAGGRYVMNAFNGSKAAPAAKVAVSQPESTAPEAAPSVPASVAAAGPPAPAPAPANSVAANEKPNAAQVKPSPVAAGLNAQPAGTEGAGAPVVTAVPQPSQQPGSNLAHLDEHLTYQYNALGRRDPFQSLLDGEIVGADVGGDAPPDHGGIKVVGIVWGATDQFALVEDVRGNSFVLRKGDKVQNGFVEGLKRDAVIVNITAEGQSQSVVIPLVRKGDQNAR